MLEVCSRSRHSLCVPLRCAPVCVRARTAALSAQRTCHPLLSYGYLPTLPTNPRHLDDHRIVWCARHGQRQGAQDPRDSPYPQVEPSRMHQGVCVVGGWGRAGACVRVLWSQANPTCLQPNAPRLAFYHNNISPSPTHLTQPNSTKLNPTQPQVHKQDLVVGIVLLILAGFVLPSEPPSVVVSGVIKGVRVCVRARVSAYSLSLSLSLSSLSLTHTHTQHTHTHTHLLTRSHTGVSMFFWVMTVFNKIRVHVKTWGYQEPINQ